MLAFGLCAQEAAAKISSIAKIRWMKSAIISSLKSFGFQPLLWLWNPFRNNDVVPLKTNWCHRNGYIRPMAVKGLKHNRPEKSIILVTMANVWWVTTIDQTLRYKRDKLEVMWLTVNLYLSFWERERVIGPFRAILSKNVIWHEFLCGVVIRPDLFTRAHFELPPVRFFSFFFFEFQVRTYSKKKNGTRVIILLKVKAAHVVLAITMPAASEWQWARYSCKPYPYAPSLSKVKGRIPSPS